MPVLAHSNEPEASGNIHGKMSPSQASFSDEDIPPDSNALIHVLNELAKNEDVSDTQTVGRLFTAFNHLCPLAFCAYSDPEEARGWNECTNDGCRVQYLDPRWLEHSTKGVLSITLKKAMNVPKYDLITESDPYIVFSLQGSRVGSKIKQDNKDPVWGSTHSLLIKKDGETESANCKLSLELFDSDWTKYKPEERKARQFLFKDELLGSIAINLKDILIPGKVKDNLIPGEVKDWEKPLELTKPHPSKQDTVVSFSTEFLSLQEALIKQREKLKAFHFWKQQDPDSEDTSGLARWDLNNIHSKNGTLKPVAFINSFITGTQVWVSVGETIKTVVVAFRGTEKIRCKDLLTIFKSKASKLGLERIDGYKLELNTGAKDKKIKVHKGFKEGYMSVRKTLWKVVYAATGWKEDWKICATGHSLGGALASLCAFDYANTRDENSNGPEIFMMSFGCPRIGNRSFRATYDKSVKHSFRVAIGKDVVCCLPPTLEHVGSELRLDNADDVLWRGNSVQQIQVHVPDESNDNSTSARQLWQKSIAYVTNANRCKMLIERWSRKGANMNLRRFRKVFGCSGNGKRFSRVFLASRKYEKPCCFSRLVSTVIDIKQMIDKRETAEQKKSSWSRCVKDHTEESYRRLLTMYIRGNPISQKLFEWNLTHSSEDYSKMINTICQSHRSRPK